MASADGGATPDTGGGGGTLDTDRIADLERRLATEGAPAYMELLDDDALVVVPGAVLKRQQCIEAIAASPGWDSIDVAPLHLRTDGPTATLTYRFRGRRGESTYRAVLASTWRRTPQGPRMVHHQQTPEP